MDGLLHCPVIPPQLSLKVCQDEGENCSLADTMVHVIPLQEVLHNPASCRPLSRNNIFRRAPNPHSLSTFNQQQLFLSGPHSLSLCQVLSNRNSSSLKLLSQVTYC